MSRYTKEDIFRIVEEENVEFIRLQFTDMLGVLKNVAITAKELEKALNNRIMFDGSAIEGFVGVEESDLCLHPDPDTFAIFPWRPQQGRVARFLCDIYYPDGTPFEGDSRRVLKEVLSRSREKGCSFLVGPECEFFLYHLDEYGQPTTITHEKAGYFDVSPSDLGENARRDIIMTMEEMGYRIDASHHEFAPGQHEIDLHYSEALYAADMITTFRLAARTVAKRHGLCATFMPKPKSGVHGSGMHINLSAVKDGVNLFEDENDPNGLSREAYWFIGGIMKHIPAITAVANPVINSYKRLASGYEAPKEISWSLKSRSILIRIPAARGFHTRIELRSPDSASNPYLTLALCIEAGMDGISNRIDPPGPVEESTEPGTGQSRTDTGVRMLPMTLKEAMEALRDDPCMRGVLGEHLFRKMYDRKNEEWQTYLQQVSEWEIDRYLSRM